MGRIRTIKPEFTQSQSMGRLPREARLLFILLWTIADDEGRARASSRGLASLLYPYDDDAVALLPQWMAELEENGHIRQYQSEGNSYLDIPNWLKHQKIDRPTPSKIPPFSRWLDEPSMNTREPSTRARHGTVREGTVEDRKEGAAPQSAAAPSASPSSTAAREAVAKKQQNGSARSLASAPNGGALTREPDSEPASPKRSSDQQRQGMSPDLGNDYRSPPRVKSDNVLAPIPERKPFNRP